MARAGQAGNGHAFKFTRVSVEAATCPAGRAQAFYRDTEQPALMLRVTAAGAKAFVFEQRLAGKTVRVTIGPATMQIRAAKDRNGKPMTAGADVEAARLAGMVAQGIDPREAKAATVAGQQAEREAAKVERAKREVTGLDAWAVYLEERRPHWGERHYIDHIKMAAAGGEPRKRMPGTKTQPGPLRTLLDRPLVRINADAVTLWVTTETKTRPARAALGFRLLIVFFNWCAEHAEYRAIAHADACAGKKTREKVAKPARKVDSLLRVQLKLWFAEVRKLPPVVAAYLQALLLTGARREELATLRWEFVNFRWGWIRIRDKVEGERKIPLTPYVAALLWDLKAANDLPPAVPRRLRADPGAEALHREAWRPSPWVFASPRAREGYLQEPRIAHNEALDAAGLPHVTLHGLRRSFATLSEWVEAPVGIVAQIMGHKPSAIAEKHYKERSIELLYGWHQKIEAWVLSEAGIEPPKAGEAGGRVLSIVGSTECM